MNQLFTIGFTKKSAEIFFNLLRSNNIEIVLDIRLNNTSQLAAFAKYPDIQFFLKEICNIGYIHDKKLAPEEDTLKKYKKKDINWNEYVKEFENTMINRNIDSYIKNNYNHMKNICLLCSEHVADECHRRLVATKFKEHFNDLEILHL